MIKVLFFAQVREVIGVDEIELEYQHAMTTNSLRTFLAAQGDKWQQALGSDNLLVAVNQTLSQWQVELEDGDEVAFFPPVTGG
ncbi:MULTISPECIES: molybdopterin synthase sulfur carrier subunit [unclassified Ferrimonas]|uniref:molybdopterin synthase sulfur carrier subunit n=1 Tax=unclassified Ferrimonas TaxID=2620587 RepID=UPI0025748DED|nr:molybdopterin synthase sulfur carrier subunit [Ferrimonas sp. YFM]BDY06904.1 molybdopterin synthase sulfur carrier subunit [Ferrimonas sp. YFM]